MKWVIAGVLAASATVAAANGYMTFSNDGGGTSHEGTYTTAGGCQAPRPPKVEDIRIGGAGALPFMESVYIHEVAASIEAAGGVCTCARRFPSWDKAEADMKSRFYSLKDDESSDWVRGFAYDERSRLMRKVREICKPQGVN